MRFRRHVRRSHFYNSLRLVHKNLLFRIFYFIEYFYTFLSTIFCSSFISVFNFFFLNALHMSDVVNG